MNLIGGNLLHTKIQNSLSHQHNTGQQEVSLIEIKVYGVVGSLRQNP